MTASHPAPTYSLRIGQTLDAETLNRAIAVRDWLLLEAVRDPDANAVLEGLAERLNQIGVPVDRLSTAIDLLHSEHQAISRFWEKGQGTRISYYDYSPHGDDDAAYLRSPFYAAHKLGSWIILDLKTTPDDRFGIVPDLKAAGYTSYVCAPIVFSNGSENGVTLATRAPGGFERRDIAALRFVMPAIASVMEIRAAWRQLNEVLSIYVGTDPQRAIVRGAVRRGQVSRLRAPILVADMRDYTRYSADQSPEQTVKALNAFFDCLVPPIERHGGEVLKYMGDGLLAIFRKRGRPSPGVAENALDAASAALQAVEQANAAGKAPFPLAAGISLHYGNAAYGNVGSGARLDFTVIGADVNIASRIATLNRPLARPLLLSEAFVGILGRSGPELGSYDLRGIDSPLRVFAPPEEPAAHAFEKASAG